MQSPVSSFGWARSGTITVKKPPPAPAHSVEGVLEYAGRGTKGARRPQGDIGGRLCAKTSLVGQWPGKRSMAPIKRRLSCHSFGDDGATAPGVSTSPRSRQRSSSDPGFFSTPCEKTFSARGRERRSLEHLVSSWGLCHLVKNSGGGIARMTHHRVWQCQAEQGKMGQGRLPASPHGLSVDHQADP